MNAVEIPTNSGRSVDALKPRLDLLARQRLEEHPHFRHRSATVIIESHGNTLVLTGRLPSCYLKEMLQQTLVTLPGVAEIDNQVDVVCCNGVSSVGRSSTFVSSNGKVHARDDNVRSHTRRARRPLWRMLTLAAPLFLLAWAPCHAVAEAWARSMFETTSHEFGTLARGSKAEFEFVFTNIYLDDVNVASARSSCACAAVRVKEPLLKTYQKGAIIASINTRAFLGRRAATITVTFDKPMFAEVRLQVTCNIQGDVLVRPDTVNFGNVEEGQSAEKRVSVGYTGRDDWKILELQNESPYLAAEVLETSRGQGQVSYELRVRLAEDAPPGYINEHLILKTNSSLATHLPILVEGRVLSAVTVSPASLFLGVLQPGEKVTRQLVVRSKKPFQIVSIRCNTDRLRIDVPHDSVPKPLHLVPVAFVAGAELGEVAGTLLVETDDGTVCELPVRAVVSRE